MSKDRNKPYLWELKNAIFKKDKGTVFSCFACGGGSTMGYKLAGFDVIGFNEIDKKMANCYIENHKPKYEFIEPIQDFKKRNDLPVELYNLDILDGSPPCSSFSLSGNREKDWGKNKKFKEGQALQVLDTLFFDFIDLAAKLQPKIFIAENVKGILMGNAKEYVKKIYQEAAGAGYIFQHFLLNSKYMGVPQSRSRVFFIGLRKDLIDKVPNNDNLFNKIPLLNLDFNETPILYKEIADYSGKPITEYHKQIWDMRKPKDKKLADSKVRNGMKCSNFNYLYIKSNQTLPTITAAGNPNYINYDIPIYLSDTEIIKATTFPQDYNFLNNKVSYICGMSVPPFMIKNIADEIYKQWNNLFRPHF